MKALLAFLYVLILGHLLCGCATTHAVATIAKSCEPSTDQEMAILEAAAKPTQAEALVAIDALGFLLCVAKKGVDEGIAALTPKAGTAALALVASDYSPVLDNLVAWRAAHP